MSTRLELIVALSKNRVIGKDNQLPWHLPDDLKFFKKTTLGLPVLMGRKTFESIGKPLPGRLNVVISRSKSFEGEQLTSFATVEDALDFLSAHDRVMVIGGAQLFELMLPRCNALYLTEIDAEVEGNVYFPPIDRAQWKMVWQEHHPIDDRHVYPFRFVHYTRIA
jgi:dihydrofolate reductase